MRASIENSVVIASLQYDGSELVDETRAIEKKETPKPPTPRFDVKEYAAYGPLAASVIVILVLGSVAMMDKFSRRKSTLPSSSIFRPLGTGITDRPPVPSPRRPTNFFEVSLPERETSSGAPAPRMLDEESREHLEHDLRETLIANGRFPSRRQSSGVEILRERLSSTVSNIVHFVNE